jgi:dTDP-4-dehydrorhamnose 3,5-epimerase
MHSSKASRELIKANTGDGTSALQRIETSLPGMVELQPRIFHDPRGFFVESYHRDRFAAAGITDLFVQDNHSRSTKGVLRGLHYQLPHAQAKLCRVVEGEALDVAVDIRLGSPHFGKWAAIILSAERQNQVYIPAGFAHGFVALTESVQLLYKCSDFYDARNEHGVLWSDPDLNISWGIENPLVSDKDSKNLKLSNIPREFLPRYSGK